MANHPTLSPASGLPASRRGLMLILSSPSGAGKTTIARRLLANDPKIQMSVSATTRPIRPGETDGQDYHFVSQATFDRMVTENAFLEWATVFNNSYGTPRAQIMTGLAAGIDFLFDIDWQGAQQLAEQSPDDVVSIFLLPPSIHELHRRLIGRGTDTDDIIAARMAGAQAEITHWNSYDYVLINDDPDVCLMRVTHILAAERLRRTRQTAIVGFVQTMLDQQ